MAIVKIGIVEEDQKVDVEEEETTTGCDEQETGEQVSCTSRRDEIL